MHLPIRRRLLAALVLPGVACGAVDGYHTGGGVSARVLLAFL